MRHMTKKESRLWRRVKKKTLLRDNIQCTICGSRKRLQVHHMNCWRYYPLERFDINNLVTLCMHCHIAIHTILKPNYRYKTTKKDYEVFKELSEYFIPIEKE